jgi:Ca-activated chloride channel family protein
MRFAEPFWLLVGALVVGLLLVLRIRSEYLTARAMTVLAGARLLGESALSSRLRRWLRVAVVSFAVAMGFVALARPQKGMKWQTLDRNGTDLLLVVDTSRSMNADDVLPTRLERTKLAVRDLVERFPGDRIGLVAFAGDALVESPMTLDHDALLETLGAFDTSIVERAGTDIGRAIDVGSAALKADSGDQKVMVLLTDGEDLEGSGLEAAKRAGEEGVTIETVGVGTPAGELVPATNDKGATVGLVRDDTGAPVRSRLDEAGLRAIAQAGHGTYRSLGPDGRGLDRLYAESLAPLARTEQGARVRRVYAEWFAVPLALSIFGVVLDALLGWKRRPRPRAKRSSGGSGFARYGVLAAAALTAFLPARADASVQDAEKAYAAGKFEDSAREYAAEQARHPKDARLAIDAGSAAYRAGHYDAAEAAFGTALKSADPKLQQRVLYDLGDARYRLGATTLADAPEKTKERWNAAVEAYEGALALAPADADARYNLDFVKRKLAELDKKQNEQAQENQSKKDGDGHDSSKGKSGGTNDKSSAGGSSSQDGKSGEGKSGDGKSGDGKSGDGKSGEAPRAQGPSGIKPGSDSGKTPGPDPAGAHDRSGKPGGGQGAPDHTDHSGKADEIGASAASPGKLSPRDARALLESLRGDERRGVSYGTSGAPPATDTPRKDW